jgi:hypothetical protein
MTTRLTLALIGLLMAVQVRAQSSDEKAVAAKVEQMRLAMVNGDRKILGEIAANELSYGHSSGTIEDKNTFVENIASGKSDFVSLDISEQTIRIIKDVAIVRHKLIGQTNDNGKTGSVKINVLLVWQKQKGQWKLIARQAAKIL